MMSSPVTSRYYYAVDPAHGETWQPLAARARASAPELRVPAASAPSGEATAAMAPGTGIGAE